MDDFKRNLILKVAGGETKNLPLIYGLEQSSRCTEILEYCARKKIVGKSFYQLCLDNKFRMFSVVSYILKRIEQDSSRKLQISDLV